MKSQFSANRRIVTGFSRRKSSEHHSVVSEEKSFMAENNLLSNVNPSFFEGVEKLLEIWFAPNPNADLRKIPR